MQPNNNQNSMSPINDDPSAADWVHPLPPLKQEEAELLTHHPEGYVAPSTDSSNSIFEPILAPPSWLRFKPSHSQLTAEEMEKLSQIEKEVPNICSPAGDPMHKEDVAFCTDRCIIRYLRACRWDTALALQRLSNTLQWRHERRPHVMDPAYIEPEAASGKLVVDGFDHCGGPVLYITPRLENTKSSQRQVDNMIFFLERAITMMPPGVEKLTFIVDFSESSVFNSPAPWVTKSIVRTLDQHYPERLHMAILVGTPWYYNQIFKLISPIIDPVTKEKIRVVELSRSKRKASIVDKNDTGNSNNASNKSASHSTWKRMSLPLGFHSRKHTHTSSADETGRKNHEDHDVGKNNDLEIESVIWEVVPPELLHRSVGGQYPFRHKHAIYWNRLLETTVHYKPELPIDVDPNDIAPVGTES
ncbi:CRAL-TRIO domain-containing protein [Syncephalis fuscata]|nr:CRAL-TRIO domain-containing protein [Syncephalis fuscata]